MYYQLNVNNQNIPSFLQALAILVQEWAELKFALEQATEVDEALNSRYQRKNEMLAFFIHCIGKLEGNSQPILLEIKDKLNYIGNRSTVHEDEGISLLNQLISSLSLNAVNRLSIEALQLKVVMKIEKVIEGALLKIQGQEPASKTAYIRFAYEEYLDYSNRFKAKNDFLAKFFAAFNCLGEKSATFSGPRADSKYYLKQALFNAAIQTHTRNAKLKEAEVEQPEVVVMIDEADRVQEEESTDYLRAQPTLIVSPMVRRHSSSFSLLLLENEGEPDDASEILANDPPPRSPSAQRFF